MAFDCLLSKLWPAAPELEEVINATLRRLPGGFGAKLEAQQVALRCSLQLHRFLDEEDSWHLLLRERSK